MILMNLLKMQNNLKNKKLTQRKNKNKMIRKKGRNYGTNKATTPKDVRNNEQ